MSKKQKKVKHDKKRMEKAERRRKKREAQGRPIDQAARLATKTVVSSRLAFIRGEIAPVPDGDAGAGDEGAELPADEYPPAVDISDEEAASIRDADVSPPIAGIKRYDHLPKPPRPGHGVITMRHRSYTPPVWQDEPGGGGPTDYFLFPGVMGYAVLKNDGSIWVCTPEPEEEHCRTDWAVVKSFLDVLHERCRVVNCVWGELLDMLVKEGWVNMPERVKAVSNGASREIDVWYPPPEGVRRQGYVEGGYGEISDTPPGDD